MPPRDLPKGPISYTYVDLLVVRGGGSLSVPPVLIRDVPDNGLTGNPSIGLPSTPNRRHKGIVFPDESSPCPSYGVRRPPLSAPLWYNRVGMPYFSSYPRRYVISPGKIDPAGLETPDVASLPSWRL